MTTTLTENRQFVNKVWFMKIPTTAPLQWLLFLLSLFVSFAAWPEDEVTCVTASFPINVLWSAKLKNEELLIKFTGKSASDEIVPIFYDSKLEVAELYERSVAALYWDNGEIEGLTWNSIRLSPNQVTENIYIGFWQNDHCDISGQSIKESSNSNIPGKDLPMCVEGVLSLPLSSDKSGLEIYAPDSPRTLFMLNVKSEPDDSWDTPTDGISESDC